MTSQLSRTNDDAVEVGPAPRDDYSHTWEPPLFLIFGLVNQPWVMFLVMLMMFLLMLMTTVMFLLMLMTTNLAGSLA